MTRWVWLLLLAGCGGPSSPSPLAPGSSQPADPPPPVAEPNGSSAAAQPDVLPVAEMESTAELGLVLRDGARRGRLAPKSATLLVTEIANIERLFDVTPKDDADRPKLIRRLAEGYVELEASATRDQVEADIKAQSLEGRDPAKAEKYRQQANKAERVAKRAQREAIQRYEMLVNEYPQWCGHPSFPEGARGCLDEVLYYLGFAYEGARDTDTARKAYEDVTTKWPKSRFAALSYLGQAELAHAEAMDARDKWPLAEKLFREVLKYPAPDNEAWGYAALRLARVLIILGKRDEANERAHDVVSFAEQYSTLPASKTFAREAKKILDELHR